MQKLRTRKDQLLYFVDLLYKEAPELPKSARAKIRKFGRDCMLCGAVEERNHSLKFVVGLTRDKIAADGVLKVLGFEK